MRTFPKPLTAENEKYYLSRLRDGDGEARRILIEYNLRLVAHIVKKYQSAEDDMEELISIGTIGLIKAVDTFDQEKARRLSTYAARCVENEILMYMRAKKKYMRETSYYEPIGTDKEGNEIQLLDIMESGEPEAMEQIQLKDDSLRIYRLLEERLSERERLVLIMRYGLYGGREYTQREIAERLGISRSYISRIEKNALHRLREYFQD
ncbi:MAG: RNA polymerase sporulation sigma factor SigK [Lachnospiraceae bacterium]|nr:RNA polymerase sporulation sigma factor SigK [Clostridiaceae bacterium]MDY3825638.1 RNA polymerase sporulation sigma factor SigK [Lachnospiraceae bacterium]QUO22173.1 RNA polymerase sporulation sigma factor SigK [Clostridiaceae bacterium Marseille-Q4143]RHU85876.1 RNA polymerase sporulation sigma factor SigK [Clostridiaceae bacterium OM08-6BH]